MALLLCSVLGIASAAAAKPLSLLNPDRILTPAAEPSWPSPLSSNLSIKASNSSLNVSEPFAICYHASGRFPLIADQCMDALVNSDFARLPPNEMLTFAYRSNPPVGEQITLPRRYLSSDGKCAIVLGLPPGVTECRNTPRNFNQAVNKLIDRCVDHNAHSGGLVINTGGDNRLEIRIFSFRPKVECYGRVDRQSMVTSCNNLADKMQKSPERTLFASNTRDPRIVALPYTETDPAGGGCEFKISFGSDRTRVSQESNWNSLWQAVVAINAMCIRHGQRGRWLSIGEALDYRGLIDIDVGEAQAEQQGSSPAATA